MSELVIEPARGFDSLNVGDVCTFQVTGRISQISEEVIDISGLGREPETAAGERTIRVAVSKVTFA